MTSDYPDLIADEPEPHHELLPDIPQRTLAPQHWTVTVADAKFHWYDLITGFPEVPDIRDPVGRYFRRMQFDLEATMEKRLLYFVVTRPRMRFDTSRSTSWGFFSLKLTLPILVGGDEKKDSVTIDLVVPFAATLKKPTVVMTDKFVTLNWGGLIEAMSIHDVLQNYDNDIDFPSTVRYVGQTKDPSGRLAKARLPAVQRIHQTFSENNDMLLLVQRLNVDVLSEDGDPGELEANQNPVAADALLRDRLDVVECALIRYFEGGASHGLQDKLVDERRERLLEAQADNHLEDFRIDLRIEEKNPYLLLRSDDVAASLNHQIDCIIADGEVKVARVPDKTKN